MKNNLTNFLKKREGGFSIIELLLAVVIISMTAAGVIPLFSKAIVANHSARNQLFAYEAANAKIEDLRNATFSTIDNGSFSVSNLSNSTGTIQIDKNIDGASRTDILKATVMVNWTFTGKAEEVKVITYITEKGLNQ